MKLLTQIILILYACCITVTAQITSLDSSSVKIDKEEFKHIINTFVDYKTLKEIHVKEIEKTDLLQRTVESYKQLLLLKADDIELLKKRIEIITPPWWDRFYWGFASGIILVISVVFLSG